MREGGIRAEADVRGERPASEIRDAQMQKIPYILVAGDKEAEAAGAASPPAHRRRPGALPVDRIREIILADAAAKQIQPGGTG